MKLSITMMVKNEEKYLEQSLLSLKPIMDNIKSELIIVDTGSEDSTVEIAKKYTEKVYFHEWNNDFANMRNKTIKYAKGEWILILDGDEIIEDSKGIIDFLNSKQSKKYNTGALTIKSILNGEDESTYSSFLALRLFRNNSKFYYEGSIHEQPKYQQPVIEIESQIIHYGYLSTDKKLMELKFQRNIRLLKEELEKDPENIYYLFQLSQSYGMHKDYKRSLEANLKAYEIAKKNKINLKNRMYIYTHLALAYYWNEKYVELERICVEALKVKDGYIDLYYYLGKAQKSLMKDREAIKGYKVYLKMLKPDSKFKIVKDLSVTHATLGKCEDVYLDLCMLYYRQEDMLEALKYARKITSQNILKSVMPYIINIYIDLQQYNELNEYYSREIIEEEDEEIIIHFWTCLENAINKLDKDEKIKIARLFSAEDDDYSLLNNIRLHISEGYGKIDDSLLEKIKQVDFESLPVFFAGIIYFLMKNKYPLGSILCKLREYVFQAHIEFLSNKYDDLSENILEYLKSPYNVQSLDEIRIRKVLKKSILILDNIDIEEFNYIWKKYVEVGTQYIVKIYNQEVIENELIYDVKNEEDAFLVYMLLAKKNKEKDRLTYIRYLRKALEVYPKMKKGIEILLEEIKEEKDEDVSDIKSEFDELKEKVKENINILLEAKKVGEAKALIDEYLRIVPNDLEMLMLKSEVQLKLM